MFVSVMCILRRIHVLIRTTKQLRLENDPRRKENFSLALLLCYCCFDIGLGLVAFEVRGGINGFFQRMDGWTGRAEKCLNVV